MFEAQILIAPDAAIVVWGPWLQRQGDNAVFTVEGISAAEDASVTVEVATKNVEDDGDGDIVSPSSGSLVVTGPMRVSASWGPGTLKELVRYRYTTGDTGSVLFRMLPPVWFDTVKA